MSRMWISRYIYVDELVLAGMLVMMRWHWNGPKALGGEQEHRHAVMGLAHQVTMETDEFLPVAILHCNNYSILQLPPTANVS